MPITSETTASIARYCHTTIETVSFAGIPPTQTCMNCHSQLWGASPIGRYGLAVMNLVRLGGVMTVLFMAGFVLIMRRGEPRIRP